jgi:hypothetical protein
VNFGTNEQIYQSQELMIFRPVYTHALTDTTMQSKIGAITLGSKIMMGKKLEPEMLRELAISPFASTSSHKWL